MALRALVRFCLRHRYGVVLVIAMLCALAFLQTRSTRVRVFPSFTPAVVKIITRVPGLMPRDIELAVTDVLEQGLTGVSGLRTTLSRSEPGVSIITLIFRSGTNVAVDRKAVAARLSELKTSFPGKAGPRIERSTSMVGIAAEVGVVGDGIPLRRVGELVERHIVPQLQATPGVSKVDVYGAAHPIIAIEPRVSAMLATGVGFASLANAARKATAVLGLGSVRSPNQRLLLDGHGQARTTRALADSVIGQRDGRPLTVGMVAQVRKATPPSVGAAMIGHQRGAVLVVWAKHGSATSAVAARVHRKVLRLQHDLRDRRIRILPDVFNPAAFSRAAVANVLRLVEAGAVAILILLIVALRDWRMIALAYTPIIVSVLGTLVTLHYGGVPLNTLGLSGLAIALAEIVHDAVADSITIQRRLLQTLADEAAPGRLQTILGVVVTVRRKVIVSAVVTSVLFLPVVVLPGVAGALFTPVAVTYITAIVISVIVSLVFSPALAGILLADVGPGRGPPLPPAPVRRLYELAIHPSKTVIVVEVIFAAVLFVAIAGSVPFLRTVFLPTFSQKTLTLHLQTTPGTSLSETEKVVSAYSTTLRSLPSVHRVVALIGRSRPSDHATDVNRATIDVTTNSKAPSATHAIEEKIRKALACPVAMDCRVTTFLDNRVHQALPSYTAPLVVLLTGTSGTTIREVAEGLSHKIRSMLSVRKVSVEPTLTRRTIIRIRPKRRPMAEYGITSHKILETVATAYRGRQVASVYERNYREPVDLITSGRTRANAVKVGRLPIRAEDGRLVPLGVVARVTFKHAVGTISETNRNRVQRLLIWPRYGSSVRDIERRISELLAADGGASGVSVSYTGTAHAVAQAAHGVIVRAAVALVVAVFLLWALLARARAVALLSFGLPVAVSGGIAMIWLFSHGTVNFAALIGLVALFGIALRNGLLLVFHYDMQSGIDETSVSLDQARKVALEMLPVVLITASAAIVGLLPLAIYAGTAGDELAGPLALVIIGGLGTGTILTALALPRILPLILEFRGKRRTPDT